MPFSMDLDAGDFLLVLLIALLGVGDSGGAAAAVGGVSCVVFSDNYRNVRVRTSQQSTS